MSRERPTINSAASDEEAWHVRMRAPGLAATPSCLCRRLGLTRVPLPLLSRLALGKNRRIRATETLPQSVRHYIHLLSGTPSSVPCPRSDACRAKELPSRLSVQQPSNQGGAYAPV